MKHLEISWEIVTGRWRRHNADWRIGTNTFVEMLDLHAIEGWEFVSFVESGGYRITIFKQVR